MAPKNKARQKPGNMRSRQQAKLNSQKAQKAPIQPAPRTGPRRQLPPSSQGGTRVGNSSQPWGQQQQTGDGVRRVRVDTSRPQLPPAETKQLPPAKTVPENRRLPGMQGPQPADRPQRPGSSRPTPDRRTTAQAKAAEAAKGTRSTSIKIGDAAKRGKMGGAAEGALFAAGSAAIDWYGKALRNAVQRERSQRAAESGQRGRYASGDQQVKFEKATPQPKQADKKQGAVKPASQQPTTMTRPPAARVSSPAPKREQKAEAQSYRDKEDTKGTSVGRYRTLAEHRAAVQAAKSLKIGSKSEGNADVYTPSTKVDGSQLDASKLSAKLDEYNKKKRKKLG